MEMPRPKDEHRKLDAFVGSWVGDEKFHPNPFNKDAGSATSKVSARKDLDGFFVISDHEQTRGGQVTYRGHGVFGWDDAKKKFTMHWFDVMGCDPGAPALGDWKGDTLQFVHHHDKGHGRFTYKFPDSNTHTLRIEFSQDGSNWAPFMDGTYKKAR